jgi:hypothetical protein
MTVDALIMLCGALVALMPFLGFPANWDSIIFFILGIFVVALGIAVRRQQVRKQEVRRPLRKPELYSESTPDMAHRAPVNRPAEDHSHLDEDMA